MNEKITEESLVNQVLELHCDISDIFLKHGLNCVGCPGAYSENIKEACQGHNIDTSLLLNDLNEFLGRA